MDYTPIYEELKEESIKMINLIDSRKSKNLTLEKKEDIEDQLYAQISVVRIKAEVLENSIDKEDDAASNKNGKTHSHPIKKSEIPDFLNV